MWLDCFWGSFFGGCRWEAWAERARPFVADALHADSTHRLLAFTGGIIFNVANLLLVAAIDIAGLAVAFPIGIGLALVIAIALAPLF
jgi:glucose uptake protein